jgi:hypothetical protein
MEGRLEETRYAYAHAEEDLRHSLGVVFGDHGGDLCELLDLRLSVEAQELADDLLVIHSELAELAPEQSSNAFLGAVQLIGEHHQHLFSKCR